MSFSIGDRVTYSNYGVCAITAVEERPDIRDPEVMQTYYVLEPLNTRLGKVFLPEERLDTLRAALNHDQAIAIIDSVKAIDVDDFSDNSHKAIEEHFRTLLRSGKVEDLICVVKSMHARLVMQSEAGKNPSSSYMRLQKEAKNRLHSEIGYALNIPEDEVEEFIASRVGD